MKDHFSSQGKAAIVLMYHKIDHDSIDPWGICVTPENFEEQIEFLKKNYNVVSIENLLCQIINRNINEKTICLTFDDGYANNYSFAKPVLEKYQCPATYFIPTKFIGKAELFWWDELAEIFLHTEHLKPNLQLNINDKQCNFKIQEIELTKTHWQQHMQWRYYENPPTTRCEVFFKVWELLRYLPNAEIQKQMNIMRAWCEFTASKKEIKLPMSEQQLTDLANNSLINIGLHTHTHPALQGKEKSMQADEIITNKNILCKKYGVKANHLAYPYGSFDDTSIETAKMLNIDCCFTTEEKNITADACLYSLGRYQVWDWGIKEFKQQLEKWMTNITKFSA